MGQHQQKRPLQVTDSRGQSMTSFAEGRIDRVAVPADGNWHLVASGAPVVRLHVFMARKGVLYTTSLAGGAVTDGSPADDASKAHSLPLAASVAPYTLTFNVPADVYVTVDPDAPDGLSDPVVGVAQTQVA